MESFFVQFFGQRVIEDLFFSMHATWISDFYLSSVSICALTKTWKLFMAKTFIKKRGNFLTLISHRHLVFTFAAAGLPLSRPWYWQGWHQRRALTLGELGLPAVNNQVYFEVRDTWTPRAKAAASPTLHTPPTSLQPPSPLVPEIPSTAVLVPDVAKLH